MTADGLTTQGARALATKVLVWSPSVPKGLANLMSTDAIYDNHDNDDEDDHDDSDEDSDMVTIKEGAMMCQSEIWVPNTLLSSDTHPCPIQTNKI